MTLSDKTLLFLEELVRTQVNREALSMQPPGAGSAGRVTPMRKAVSQNMLVREGLCGCPHLSIPQPCFLSHLSVMVYATSQV